jgi:GNAT superfamily N-acetyltransferase
MTTLRKATQDEQTTIFRLVLSELLNPRDLRWQNFIIAEDDETGQIVGIGQIRLHETPHPPAPSPMEAGRGGEMQAIGDDISKQPTIIKELASIVVVPGYRGQGIGATLIAALEARAGYPLYLMSGSHNVAYYQRLGYVETDDAAAAEAILPPRVVMWFVRRVLRAKIHIMKKAATPAPS